MDISDANHHLQIHQSFSMSHETVMCFLMCQECFRQPFANGRSSNQGLATVSALLCSGWHHAYEAVLPTFDFKGTRLTCYFNTNEALTDVNERSVPAYE